MRGGLSGEEGVGSAWVNQSEDLFPYHAFTLIDPLNQHPLHPKIVSMCLFNHLSKKINITHNLNQMLMLPRSFLFTNCFTVNKQLWP